MLAGDDPAILSQGLCGHLSRAKMPLDAVSTRDPHDPRAVAVSKKRYDRLSHRSRVSRRHEQPCFAVDDDVARSAHVAGHDRCGDSHRLEEHQSEWFFVVAPCLWLLWTRASSVLLTQLHDRSIPARYRLPLWSRFG